MVWEIEDGKKLWQSPAHNPIVTSAQFAPQGDSLVTVGDRIRFIDPLSGKLQRELQDTFPPPALNFTFLPKSDLLAGILYDKIVFWRVSDGEMIRTLEFSSKATSFDINPQGTLLIVGLESGEIQFWTVQG